MSLIDLDSDRAVAVEERRSTASVVPSPMRLPNETFDPSVGAAVRRASSAEISSLRAPNA